MMNKTMLIGHLGRDPEVRTFQDGRKVASFRMATSRSWKDKSSGERKEQTEWHSVAVFGALADVAEKYLKKGAKVYVCGELRTRKWQDQSGNDRYTTEVVLNGPGAELQMLDRKERDPGPGDDAAYGAEPPDDRHPLDDDIPF